MNVCCVFVAVMFTKLFGQQQLDKFCLVSESQPILMTGMLWQL